MTYLEQRMSECGWDLVSKQTINGLHAGDITRISISDEKGNIKKLIYKEFAADRNNEIEIYKELFTKIKSYVPVIKVWTSEREAILMKDLGDSLKGSFDELPNDNKRILLNEILLKLSDLHTANPADDTPFNLPEHKITTEWYDWCCMQFDKLESLKLGWYNPYWFDKVKESYNYIESGFKAKNPLVLTHGDPHLDNIFKINGSVLFIDWEWTALASPFRDLTILLQDIYELPLINFVKEHYFILLNDKGLSIDKRNYMEDFNYLYIDHTLMMLAWEIEKFIQGYISEEKVEKVIAFKIGQLQNTAEELNFLMG